MATLTRSTPTETTEEAAATVQWMSLARAGAIVMVTWSVILQVLAGLIPPVAVIGAIFLGFVPFLSGERRKLALVYAVLATLAIGGNLPPVIDELSNPESSPAFILTLLSVVGVTLAMPMLTISVITTTTCRFLSRRTLRASRASRPRPLPTRLRLAWRPTG